MQEFSRLLKPGGYLILSVPFIYSIHEAPYDYWRFTKYGLERLCQSVELNTIYIHSKNSIGATIFALWTLVTIWILNMISKMLHLSKPLRDYNLIRRFLVMPQQFYLWFSNRLTLPDQIKQVSSRMTPGYILLARRPDNPK